MPDRHADAVVSEVRARRPALLDAALAGLATLVPAAEPAGLAGALAWLRDAQPRTRIDWAALRVDPHPDDRALMRVADALALEDAELLACVLALRVEVDALLAHALATLQGAETWQGPARPTAGLVARLAAPCLGSRPEAPAVVARLLGGAALGTGLLRFQQEELPAVQRPIAVAPALCDVLLQACPEPKACRFGLVEVGPLKSDTMPVPPAWLDAVERHARVLGQADTGQVVVLRSAAPAESFAVAAMLGQRLGLAPVRIEGAIHGFRDNVPGEMASAADLLTSVPPSLEPWLIARRALPVFRCEMAPGDRVHPPAFAHYRGPVVLVCGVEGDVDASFDARPVLQWRLPIPSRAERAELWRATLGADVLSPDDAQAFAREHRGGAAAVVSLARAAMQARAACDARGGVQRADVRDAMLTDAAGFGALSGLAQRVLPSEDAEALVVGGAAAQELELVLARCRARDELVQGLGPATRARYTAGVKVLFHGPSGTGKTLAVHWLAWRLGKPLFRVDLAAVSSKYIGETEKNLSQLLARAEHGDGILLFDEADALFGTRTEVKQANDRFANAQTNYLLQRIESFEGVAILTANSKARFDDAFMRRLDAVVEFPLPNAIERRALWDAHLGADHDVDASALARLAAEVDLPGGHVRNAVLTAALLARTRGEPVRIALGDLLASIALEYTKLGRQPPATVAALA
jgi:hypothetical protein